MEKIEIIILANSIKIGNRCIAGKDIKTGKWIRPVSEMSGGAISESKCAQYNLLDIVQIPFKELKPEAYQPENILINSMDWQVTGKYCTKEMDKLLDNPDGIWNFGDRQDRVTVDSFQSKKAESSLLLISPKNVRLIVGNYNEKPNLKTSFTYMDKNYTFGLTDIKYRENFLKEKEGTYLLKKEVLFTISLGEPFKGDCYKLVAAVIEI